MEYNLADLTIDINDIDLENICSCWQWRLKGLKGLALISKMGDMFLTGEDNCVYWLQTDSGDLTKVAESLGHFEEVLSDETNIDNLFLPELVKKLVTAGKVLNKGQVYSYLKLPVIGGEYSIENIEPVDVSVHFAFSGQICEQIQNLPDGTKVKITFNKRRN